MKFFSIRTTLILIGLTIFFYAATVGSLILGVTLLGCAFEAGSPLSRLAVLLMQISHILEVPLASWLQPALNPLGELGVPRPFVTLLFHLIYLANSALLAAPVTFLMWSAFLKNRKSDL